MISARFHDPYASHELARSEIWQAESAIRDVASTVGDTRPEPHREIGDDTGT